MVDLKTKKNEKKPKQFLESGEHNTHREDSLRLLVLTTEWTGMEPKMGGGSIIGYGNLHYKYARGCEGDWFYCDFSPRKARLSIHENATHPSNKPLSVKLGKHKTGASCLYVNTLEDIDLNVLKKMVQNSLALECPC